MLPLKFLLLTVAFGMPYVCAQVEKPDIDYTVLRGQAVSKVAERMFSQIPDPLPIRKCDIVCTMEYQPVCGFNWCEGFATFGNRCGLNSHNSCEISYYEYLFDGICEEVFGYICLNDLVDFADKRKK